MFAESLGIYIVASENLYVPISVLKLPKSEIFDRLDFHDFYTIKYLYRLHTAFLHWPLSSAATKEVQGPDTT